ncbi:MAG TPA: acyltransferase domain-containing protein, partial [Acidimicrobiales bacterium]|nr:acyltransferase domain-containing protein [Acidimicrobiales bacterium]
MIRSSERAWAASDISAAEVIAALDLGSEDAELVRGLADLRQQSEVAIPSPDDAASTLETLGVSEIDADEVVASLPGDDERERGWWLKRASGRVISEIGSLDATRPTWRNFEGTKEVPSWRRCFIAHVFLTVLPHTRAWHASLGLDDDVSWASLADLRRHMAIHRRVFGATGVEAGAWLLLPVRGELFDLGRLQFERLRLERSLSSPWVGDLDVVRTRYRMSLEDCWLGVHIPGEGPLRPPDVDEALFRAATFFPKHFRDEFSPRERALGTCTSWMLDPQLLDYLPNDSNIACFQRRFELLPERFDGDEEIMRFIFRRPLSEVEALPRTTRLERAVLDHLEAGGHWYVRTGWLELPAPGAYADSADIRVGWWRL